MKDIVRKQQEILSSCEHNKTTNVANDNYQDTEVVHPEIIKQIQTTLNEIEENGLWNEEVEDEEESISDSSGLEVEDNSLPAISSLLCIFTMIFSAVFSRKGLQ